MKFRKIVSFIYRILVQFIDPIRLITGIPKFLSFLNSYIQYWHLEKITSISLLDLHPQIHDKTLVKKFDSHYYYQGYWAFKKIYKSGIPSHLDVGSQIDFTKYLSIVVHVVFIDIRPLLIKLDNYESKEGSILALPFDDGSMNSISCLHVIEHIGLGRYGDSLDPFGSEKAALELIRILSSHGSLYLSTPIGKPRICFNAHRIRTSHQVLNMFAGLILREFSVIDDNGKYIENADINLYLENEYACGLFHFEKP